MTLLAKYSDLLSHLGSSCQLKEFHQREGDVLIGLRHDVDYDIDVALEMAWLENSLGFSSTYFLLSGTKYWESDDFLIKARQISEFGHEVGLHLNTLAQWYKNETDSSYDKLQQDLDYLRSSNIEVTGVASHGDKACYRGKFVNHWVFSDSNYIPEGLEVVSAEGIYVEDVNFQIHAPKKNSLKRLDEKVEHFQQGKLADFNLAYLASDLKQDLYFSDSGGDWIRTPSPFDLDLRSKRAQVLIHPIHWLDKSRKIFVLSPARTGSKFMSNVFDKTTSLKGLHEKTLNMTRLDDVWVDDKITTLSWRDYQNNQQLLTKRLKESYAWYEDQSNDSIEFNVYLADVIETFKAVFPGQPIIGLIRHPYLILRSLLNRGWYETGDDSRHKEIRSLPSNKLGDSQLQRCITYIKTTFEVIERNAITIIRLEEIAADTNNLKNYIEPLSIAYYPCLADQENWNQVDKTGEFQVPPIIEWPSELQEQALNGLGKLCKKYGYEAELKNSDINNRKLLSSDSISKLKYSFAKDQKYHKGLSLRIGIYRDVNTPQPEANKFEMPISRHASLFVSGLPITKTNILSTQVLKWNSSESGIDHFCNHLAEYEFTCGAKNLQGKFTIFLLMYDEARKLSDKKAIAVLEENNQTIYTTFRIAAYASYFRIALYSSKSKLQNIIELDIEKLSLKIKTISLKNRFWPF